MQPYTPIGTLYVGNGVARQWDLRCDVRFDARGALCKVNCNLGEAPTEDCCHLWRRFQLPFKDVSHAHERSGVGDREGRPHNRCCRHRTRFRFDR